jgi:hypothetical protein
MLIPSKSKHFYGTGFAGSAKDALRPCRLIVRDKVSFGALRRAPCLTKKNGSCQCNDLVDLMHVHVLF